MAETRSFDRYQRDGFSFAIKSSFLHSNAIWVILRLFYVLPYRVHVNFRVLYCWYLQNLIENENSSLKIFNLNRLTQIDFQMTKKILMMIWQIFVTTIPQKQIYWLKTIRGVVEQCSFSVTVPLYRGSVSWYNPINEVLRSIKCLPLGTKKLFLHKQQDYFVNF